MTKKEYIATYLQVLPTPGEGGLGHNEGGTGMGTWLQDFR